MLGLIGGFAALCLPETLYRKLPNTLSEAKQFGKDQVGMKRNVLVIKFDKKFIYFSIEILVPAKETCRINNGRNGIPTKDQCEVNSKDTI